MKQRTKEEFLSLLEPVYPRLSTYALAITRNADEAKDLTSDTVLIMLEQFEKIKNKEHFAGYLFKIASRLYKRRKHRDRFRAAYDQTAAEVREDEFSKPDQAAEIALVMAALDRLPPKVKETVALFDVADLSLEEIRNIQGGTLSGVKSRLKRGREIIKHQLGIKENREGMSVLQIKPENFNSSFTKKGKSYAL